jgi:hypothetical protein
MYCIAGMSTLFLVNIKLHRNVSEVGMFCGWISVYKPFTKGLGYNGCLSLGVNVALVKRGPKSKVTYANDPGS